MTTTPHAVAPLPTWERDWLTPPPANTASIDQAGYAAPRRVLNCDRIRQETFDALGDLARRGRGLDEAHGPAMGAAVIDCHATLDRLFGQLVEVLANFEHELRRAELDDEEHLLAVKDQAERIGELERELKDRPTRGRVAGLEARVDALTATVRRTAKRPGAAIERARQAYVVAYNAAESDA